MPAQLSKGKGILVDGKGTTCVYDCCDACPPIDKYKSICFVEMSTIFGNITFKSNHPRPPNRVKWNQEIIDGEEYLTYDDSFSELERCVGTCETSTSPNNEKKELSKCVSEFTIPGFICNPSSPDSPGTPGWLTTTYFGWIRHFWRQLVGQIQLHIHYRLHCRTKIMYRKFEMQYLYAQALRGFFEGVRTKVVTVREGYSCAPDSLIETLREELEFNSPAAGSGGTRCKWKYHAAIPDVMFPQPAWWERLDRCAGGVDIGICDYPPDIAYPVDGEIYYSPCGNGAYGCGRHPFLLPFSAGEGVAADWEGWMNILNRLGGMIYDTAGKVFYKSPWTIVPAPFEEITYKPKLDRYTGSSILGCVPSGSLNAVYMGASKDMCAEILDYEPPDKWECWACTTASCDWPPKGLTTLYEKCDVASHYGPPTITAPVTISEHSIKFVTQPAREICVAPHVDPPAEPRGCRWTFQVLSPFGDWRSYALISQVNTCTDLDINAVCEIPTGFQPNITAPDPFEPFTWTLFLPCPPLP